VSNEYLPIKTHDDVLLPARLFKPDDFDAGKKYPVIVYTFSGPHGRVVSDSWGGWEMAWNRLMVRKGYLVLAVDVRGSGGYSHLYEEYIHYRFGAQETADLREVVSFLRRQSYVDGERLGIWGRDYGGHTVVHAMFEFPHGFKAGFADSPITDWHEASAYFAERYLGLPAQRHTEYDDSSALENARRMTGELMVAARPGDAQLEALQKEMDEPKQAVVAKRFHVFALTDAGGLAAMEKAMTEFFEHTL
jgi:dipeptidyl-peptidase-4